MEKAEDGSTHDEATFVNWRQTMIWTLPSILVKSKPNLTTLNMCVIVTMMTNVSCIDTHGSN